MQIFRHAGATRFEQRASRKATLDRRRDEVASGRRCDRVPCRFHKVTLRDWLVTAGLPHIVGGERHPSRDLVRLEHPEQDIGQHVARGAQVGRAFAGAAHHGDVAACRERAEVVVYARGHLRPTAVLPRDQCVLDAARGARGEHLAIGV